MAKKKHPHNVSQPARIGDNAATKFRAKDARDNQQFLRVLAIATLLLLVFMYYIFNR